MRIGDQLYLCASIQLTLPAIIHKVSQCRWSWSAVRSRSGIILSKQVDDQIEPLRDWINPYLILCRGSVCLMPTMPWLSVRSGSRQ